MGIEKVTEKDRKDFAMKVFLQETPARIAKSGFTYGEEE
jgi:hypothetical protein